jgi:broad specificity phosphatase PhoE
VSTLLLVRHGQASFFGEDYDQLSPQGRLQARRVGEWLAEAGRPPQRVFVGPLRRHRQTAEEAAAAYLARAGGWPELVLVDDLAEHEAPAVMKSVLALDQASGNGALTLPEASDPEARERAIREYFRRWEQVSRRWIAGEFPDLPHEPWQMARARAARALAHMTADSGPGETRVAFSSGGLICMILGELLELEDQRVFDLSLAFGNGAIAEIRYSGSRRSLAGFNLRAHLGPEPMHSMV